MHKSHSYTDKGSFHTIGKPHWRAVTVIFLCFRCSLPLSSPHTISITDSISDIGSINDRVKWVIEKSNIESPVFVN